MLQLFVRTISYCNSSWYLLLFVYGISTSLLFRFWFTHQETPLQARAVFKLTVLIMWQHWLQCNCFFWSFCTFCDRIKSFVILGASFGWYFRTTFMVHYLLKLYLRWKYSFPLFFFQSMWNAVLYFMNMLRSLCPNGCTFQTHHASSSFYAWIKQILLSCHIFHQVN